MQIYTVRRRESASSQLFQVVIMMYTHLEMMNGVKKNAMHYTRSFAPVPRTTHTPKYKPGVHTVKNAVLRRVEILLYNMRGEYL